MNGDILYTLILILIAAGVTIMLRAIPFILFGGGRAMPPMVKKVADIMPPAIIAVLVIYCLKGQMINISMDSLCAFISVIGVIAVHLWRRQTLLSIAVGTALYMVLIRVLI